MRDPSWSEINHFITFFDLQLKSCENSDFFIPDVIKEDLPGLKEFVVKFMIQMSRVHVTIVASQHVVYSVQIYRTFLLLLCKEKF